MWEVLFEAGGLAAIRIADPSYGLYDLCLHPPSVDGVAHDTTYFLI